jgi:hypothetical protein
MAKSGKEHMSKACGVAVLVICMSMASATAALACPVCFGAADSPQVKGMQMGILALLGVTVVMLGAFAGFFLYLRRRLRAAEMMEQASAVQQAAHGGSY